MAVNLSPLAGAGWQFSDNSGVILSGGLLYTYTAGTTTPQATYTSSGGGTANSNPIVLDAYGRTANEVWLTQGIAYKFVLKTSAAVTIGTYDNISGINDFGALSASSGSSLIGYLPATGSATNVQAAIRALQASDLTFALKGANTDITSLASPALGAATATTATTGDNSTKVATTAFVNTAAGSNIISFPDPTLAGFSMTLPVATSAISLAFRSTTPSSGLATTVTGTPAALTIPAGATLGTISGVQSTIVEVLINNAGTLERAVVNLSGDNNLSETTLINTTAMSSSSSSANVFYSSTARTGVAYRVVRTITSTQTTAGSWVTAPSAVQGAGGNALTSIGEIYSSTAAATTSGTSVTFGSLPINTKRVTFMLSGVATNGTSLVLLRLGTSSGLETTGYSGYAGSLGPSNQTGTGTSTAGVLLGNTNTSGRTYTGTVTCVLLNYATNTWVVNASLQTSDNWMQFSSYSKSLANILTQISLTTETGVNTFTAGSVNILYE